MHLTDSVCSRSFSLLSTWVHLSSSLFLLLRTVASTSLQPQQSHRSILIVTSVVGSRFSSLARKEFRPKNSNARGSLFGMQGTRTLREKIWGGWSERSLSLLERKSQRQKWTQETHYRGRRWALRHRFTGLAWGELPLPAAPLVTSLMEILSS